MGVQLTEIQKEILKKNYCKNINIINFAENYPVSNLQFVNDSVVMTAKSDNNWTYISLAADDDMEDVLSLLKKEDKHIVVFDKCILDYLKASFEVDWVLSCAKMVYRGNHNISNEDVYELSKADAQYIQENNSYGDFTDASYIAERIENGIGLGIKDKDKLIAWILTHDDGAIGFMKVLEDYRNNGYAMKLSNEIIRRLLEKGKIPFVHIEKDNLKSINLAKKAGFEYAGDINWIKLS